ncbi:MAG: efflux RND transporter permease subunit [Novosphingobium sp.]|nr:efflux RND transporter permease subunit [Novosphingobium sp.]MCP5389301.1 efflux RND transporter permease subunit [Novosphingobium sp.]
MSLRNMSAWSIRNPIVPLTVFAGLLLAGIVAFIRMDVNDLPDVDFPMVTVSVVQPGAAPSEITSQITEKVEAAVRSISGVDEIQSTATEGSSRTMVQFVIGTNSNDAVNEVKNAVDQVRGDLPDGILEPQISKVEPGGAGPIGIFAVRADDMTMEQLSWFVDDTVARRLLGIQGMAAVSRFGGVDREIRVVLDPQRMQSLGVTAGQVNNALRQVNLNISGGKAEIAGSRQSVRVLGNARDAYELSQTQVALAGGRSVKLADVADVSDGFSEQESIAKVRGRDVVVFGIERSKGASDVTVYDAAIEELRAIEAENPGISFKLLTTSVDYIKGQYASSIEAMIEGAVLAVLVVFLFLRDWRATVISAIAIPLSAIPTFWFMSQLGFTLNTMSLLALSLVAGVLVDDAIVEIENIVRHMRMGKSAYQASIDAADEIGLAVVATTFSIVAVFLPVGLMPGISGQFFKSFGLTVVAAVLMSLAVARLITPMAAAYFLKAHGQAEHGGGRLMDSYMRFLAWTLDTRAAMRLRAQLVPAPACWWYYPLCIGLCLLILAAGGGAAYLLFRGLQSVLSALGMGGWGLILAAALAPVALPAVVMLAGRALRTIVWRLGAFGTWLDYAMGKIAAYMRDHRFYAFCGGVYALVLTIALLAGSPQQFQPDSDADSARVSVELVPGTTIEETERVTGELTDLVEARSEVAETTQVVREGSATIYVNLSPDRKMTSVDFVRSLASQLQTYPDARINVASMAPSGGAGVGTGRDITVMLTGSDPDKLQEAAQQVVEQMRGIRQLVAPRLDADLKRPELVIVPDFALAARLGVTTAALSEAVRIATIGEIDRNSAKFSLSDRQIPIRVILPKQSRRDLDTIRNIPVVTSSGASVPLSRVAAISFGSGPTAIQRYNQSRRVFIGADLAPGAVKGPVMKQILALPAMKNLPPGVQNAPIGDDKWQAEMIGDFAVAVISGVLLVFAVLILLYKRLVSPLVNMTSLLLAPLGGLLALALLGHPISMPVYIGILMLLGIVAKNSILLIDFALEEMDKGVAKFDAIMDAGHKRAQPIVMTTVAMTAGMVPTALSLAGDSAWRSPMGITVIGGLLLSTLLTLVIVPAGFSLADGFEKRVGPWLSRRFLTYDAEQEARAAAVDPAE